MKNEIILTLAVTAVIAIAGAVTTDMKLEHSREEYKCLQAKYGTLQCEYIKLSHEINYKEEIFR